MPSLPTSFEYYRDRKPGYTVALPRDQLNRLLDGAGLDVEHVYGTQAYFGLLESVVRDEHRPAFEALSRYHPPEIVAAVFAPLYPESSLQNTFLCRRRRERPR